MSTEREELPDSPEGSGSLEELRQLRAQFEILTYSITHDLRAPLRAIEGFSRAVLEDYAERLDERGAGYLKRIHQAALQMSEILQGFAQWAKLQSRVAQLQAVDLTGAVHTVFQQLALRENRDVRLQVEPRLAARADLPLVVTLLEKLLENAVKFTRTKPAPEIQVGRVEGKRPAVFYVRDNGIGFDPAYQSKLFLPFQRLHTPADSAGPGLGLAIARQAVEKHGGRIWAESEPDRGATFYFTLEPERKGA